MDSKGKPCHLLKTLFISIGLSLLTACGAGSDGSDIGNDDASDAFTSNNQTIQEDARAISGAAIKGVIRNGLVSVYAISDGVLGTVLGSGSTDTNGDYRVYIEASYDGPIQIVITPKTDSDSEMVCDAADGCGSYDASSPLDLNANGLIDFGEAFILNNNFELSAVVPASNHSEVTVNITSITHMAARYAAGLSNGLHSDGIDAANSQIARLFNLSGDLLSLSPTDLTNPSARANANQNDLIYSLIAAAIASLADSDTLIDQINQLAQNFADHNGQLIMNGSDTEITLEDLAQEAVDLADMLGLNAPATTLSQLLHQSQIATANSISEASPSPTIGVDNLAKAKALVADLELWQGLIRFEEEPTLGFVQYGTALQEAVIPEMATMTTAFAASAIWGFIPVLPELAISTYCGSLGSSFITSLCNSLVSTDSIELMCIGGSGLVFFGIDACDVLAEIKLVNNEQLKVTYLFFEGKITVVGTIEDHAVDMTMSTNASSDDSIANGIITFNMSGVIENSGATLTLNTGTLQFNFADEINLTQFNLPESAEALFTGTLAQKITDENQNPVSYSGSLTASIDLSALVEITAANEDHGAAVLLEQAALSLGNENSADFEINLSGTLSAENGDTMDSAFVIHGGENSYYSLSFDVVTEDLSTEANALITGALSTSALTSDEWSTEMELGSPIQLLSQMKITLDYQGRHIEIERDATDLLEYEILNQDSVLISLDFGVEAGDDIGELSIYNQSFATVTKEGAMTTFHYNDGSIAEMAF